MEYFLSTKQVARLAAAALHTKAPACQLLEGTIPKIAIRAILTQLIDAYVKETGVPLDKDGWPIKNLPVVEFVYVKPSHYPWMGQTKTAWRTIRVTEEDETHIKGYEGDEFKCFLKERILDGKIIRK
jgi:hypothetical protein